MSEPLVSLEEIRDFCRLDDGLDADLETTLETAREGLIDFGGHQTGRDWRKEWVAEPSDPPDPDEKVFPEGLKLWLLNRIAIQVVEFGISKEFLDRLLDPWRTYGCPKAE